MAKKPSAIELKVMENFKLKNIEKFNSDYYEALKNFNLCHQGIAHDADYAVKWLVNFLYSRGYERK